MSGNKFKKIVLVIFFLMDSLPLLFSNEHLLITEDSSQHVIPLISQWYFSPHDDITYRYGQSSGGNWYPDNPEDTWQKGVPEAADYKGIGWYNLSFDMGFPAKPHDLGIAIPFSYSGYQLYLNGTLLYETSPFEGKNELYGSPPVVVEFPSEKLEKYGNQVSLRVSSVFGMGGFGSNGLEQPYIKIGPYNKLVSQWARFLIQYTAIGFISIFLFLFFLFRYFQLKERRFNLYFALLSLSVGMFIMGYYGFWNYFSRESWAYWLLTFLGGINMYLLPILFIHSFFNLKKGIIPKIFIFFYLALNLLLLSEYCLTGGVYYFQIYIYNIFILSYILLVIYLIALGITVLRKKLKYAPIMFVGILLLGLSFIYSTMVFIGIIHYTPFVGEGFFLMILVFSFVLAKSFAQTHKNLTRAHTGLLEASQEIKSLNLNLEKKVRLRTAELQEKNNLITESIEYASLIQHSVQPSSEELEAVFADHFIIWKPRDIVGGDQYWMKKDEQGFLLAIMDCTGHGVPGSLLTMTAVATLDHVVNHMEIVKPADVLWHLNRIMKTRLNQGDTSIYADDGMDIALVRYDSQQKKVLYAGSRIRLYVREKGMLTEYKGDREGIGYKRSKADYPFSSHEIPLSSSARYYLTTDGYIEQSGGEKHFGFGWTRFKELLSVQENASMEEMKKNLENTFDDYRKKLDQRDDVLVCGFQIRTS